MVHLDRVSRIAAGLHPLAKLAVCVAAVGLVELCVRLGALVVGSRFSLFDKHVGSGILICVALVVLLAMMAVEGRPLANYGLVIERGWRRKFLKGALAGGGVYAAYCALGIALGAATLQGAWPDMRGASHALVGVALAAPLAATQQIIFSGCLLGMLRSGGSVWPAVMISAALFAAACGVGRPEGLAGAEGQRLFVGMFLLASLLGVLRLTTGSVTFPSGVLAGCLAVRKISANLRLVCVEPTTAWAPWFAPADDARQGPLLWGVLAGLLAVAVVLLLRHGERRGASDERALAQFHRTNPFSNLLQLTPLDRWAVLLWRSGFSVGLRYLPRLGFTLLASTLNTVLALPERLLAPLLLRGAPRAPVFVVGVNRSGTTHLHNLLALDPQFRAPRNYEVFNPHGFLTGWLTTAFMTPFLLWRRPMDSVQMTPLSSQEEEFALAALGSPSPYWGFEFPRDRGRHDRYWWSAGFAGAELARWRRHYVLFLRKITLFSRRTPLLKNPANTARLELLRSLFPGAKYIHIVRRPEAVLRSNQRFAQQGLAVFQLQDPDPADNYATEFIDHYRKLMEGHYQGARGLTDAEYATVRFEDLEQAPEEQIALLYEQLGLKMTQQYRERLRGYLESVSGYQKNRFEPIAPAEQARLDASLRIYAEAWGYVPAEAPRQAA